MFFIKHLANLLLENESENLHTWFNTEVFSPLSLHVRAALIFIVEGQVDARLDSVGVARNFCEAGYMPPILELGPAAAPALPAPFPLAGVPRRPVPMLPHRAFPRTTYDVLPVVRAGFVLHQTIPLPAPVHTCR